MSPKFCFFAIFCTGILARSLVHGREELTLAVFVSSINNTGSIVGGSGVGRPFVEAVEIAVERINNNASLLPNYTLRYELTDPKCFPGPSVRGFIDQIFMEPTKIMIIGADCSPSSEPIAELAPFWNLVQISTLSTSPRLSNTDPFRSFFRVVSSDVAVTNGIATLMLRYNWTRLAVITQQEGIFTSTFTQLNENLRRNITNSTLQFSFNTNNDPRSAVNRLSSSPTRIIFMNTFPDYAVEIMCQAYRLGLTPGAGYQWILFAWYPENWWKKTPARRDSYVPENCTQSTLEEMVKYSILIDHFAHVDEDRRSIVTDTGLSTEEFDAMLQERVDTSTFADQARFYFDAVWTAALALHETAYTNGFDLSEFSYDPTDNNSKLTTSIMENTISNNLFNNTRSLQFLGVSGLVKFDELGDRLSFLRYFQHRGNGTRVLIGDENGFRDTDFIFPNGVPKDEEFVFINRGLFIVYTILACIGILFAVACLVVNIVFRKNKVVKLSSPYLNILIVVGVVLFYLDVILFGVDEGTPAPRCSVNALCMVRIWIATIAFSLVFGTIFAKTWRVYYVFYSSNKHKRSTKNIIQDWVLFLMVGVLVVLDIIFLIFVTAFPSSRLTLQDKELVSNTRALPQIVGLCGTEPRATRLAWLAVLFVYKGILLIVGTFLAFETRKVKIRHLNDSKLIGMAVYGIVILSIPLAAIGILLEDFVDVFYSVVGIMVMLGNTFLLCLIFIPKFYGLWKDPEGLNIMGGGTTTVNRSSDSKEIITQLQQEIQKLRHELNRLSTVDSSTNKLQSNDSMFAVITNSKTDDTNMEMSVSIKFEPSGEDGDKDTT